MKTMIGFVLLAAAAQAQTVTYTYSYSGPALPIFRDSADVITIAYVFVPRAIRITKVTANIEIDYPRPGDLNLYMYSPILTRTKLLERNCGSNGSVADVTFDDSAPSRYSDVCPSSPGSYRGNEPLSNFNGQVAFGTWSLAAENNGSDSFIGYLRGFSVTITGSVVTNKPITSTNSVYNSVGFQSAAVAPGEMVDIAGFNLGPTPAVTAPAGDLPATLGGVQVTFDGVPAAISYVSSYLLTVQTPFSVQPGKQTTMQVSYGGASSDPITLDVFNVVPGLYTQTPDGKGLITAVNSNGSMNSLLNPAAKGGNITIYASGLGTVSPALATGQTPPASPVSNTTWPVTAAVDGINATVSFAGAAPGFPGLYQINLQIPAGANSGARSIVLYGGGAPSQFGTIIYVQ